MYVIRLQSTLTVSGSNQHEHREFFLEVFFSRSRHRRKKKKKTLRYWRTLGKSGPVNYHIQYKTQNYSQGIVSTTQQNSQLVSLKRFLIEGMTKKITISKRYRIEVKAKLTLCRVEDRPVPITNNGLQVIMMNALKELWAMLWKSKKTWRKKKLTAMERANKVSKRSNV